MYPTLSAMQHCMLCNKTGRIFNIFEDWNGKHTIRDDLLEIFGMKVEPYLQEDDVICNLCMNIMENFAKLKRRLWPIIIDRSSRAYDTTPIKFGKLWDLFATFPVEDEPDTLMSCPSPSPSLLKYSHSKPYHEALETKIAAREGARRKLNLSRASSTYYSDNSLNREVSDITNNKRKRRKRKGKTKLWTRKKNKSRISSSRDSLCLSSLSNYQISPVDSSDTDCSYQSFYLPRSRPMTSTSMLSSSSLRYEDGRLINKQTRSVSRAQEEEESHRLASLEKDGMNFNCSSDSCVGTEFNDLDSYTFHKRSKHMYMAQYTCDMGCTNRYITKEHLELHKKLKHDNELLLCSMCGIDVMGPRALQRHVEEHLAYSVPCIYCDKYFLDKKHKDDHVKEYHKGKKRRIKQVHHGIIDRVDKSDSEEDDSESEPASPIPFEKKPFSVRVITSSESGENERRTEENNPPIISLFGRLLTTTPVSHLSTRSTSQANIGDCTSADTNGNATDSIDISISDSDESDAPDCVDLTGTTEDVVQSNPLSDSCIISDTREPTNYISIDTLDKQDKLFTKCVKIVLTDYFTVPPATMSV